MLAPAPASPTAHGHPGVGAARKSDDKRAKQPIAAENQRLTRTTDPTTIRLARLNCLSFIVVISTRVTHVVRNAVATAIASSALLLAAGPAGAGPAFTIDNTTGPTLGNPPFTLGWQFTTSQAIEVTDLGMFDDSQDGLVDSHQVGIWDSGGALVASGTVSRGTAEPLVNQFRYASIGAVTLGIATYQIGALFLTGNDALIVPGFATNFAAAPEITFNQSMFAAGGTLADPTNSGFASAGYFGPNFLYDVQSVPEPASLLLVGIGLVGMRLLRRCRA